MTDFDEARDYKFLKDGAHSRIITSVLSHFEGLDVLGHKFSLSKLDGGKIWYEIGGFNWRTYYTESGATKPKIVYSGSNKYEATVENFASSAIIHEWYSHGVQHVHDRFNNHSRAYFNVLYVNPLAWKTTKKYKDFNKDKFDDYLKKEISNYHK